MLKVKAWLKGHEEDAIIIELKGLLTTPILPMNVRNYLCRMGLFSWRDYVRIRYQRLKDKDKNFVRV